MTPGKKKKQLCVWQVRNRYYDRKIKKFQSSVWPVRDRNAGARSLLRPENKKVLVVCLAGARSLLRPEK
jgi:hypothetical protein